jgi:hypothetical protein
MPTLPPFRPPASLPPLPAAALAEPAAWHSWQAVHTVLASQPAAAYPPPGFANLTAYHYCVHQAFGRGEPAPALLTQDFQQLVGQLEHQAGLGAWPAAQLDQACVAAWLSTQLAPQGGAPALAVPAQLDEALYAEAVRLHHEPDASSRHCFFRVLRYFSLRLPTATVALPQLQALLALQPEPPAAEQLALGLVEGLAAELLLLLKLHKAGFRQAPIVTRIRAGITRLLMVRHPVDFQEGQYSVFPYQVLPTSQEAAFSAELSWQRGDLGQSLLLYKAHELMQDEELIKIAELVGLNTLLRTTVQATGISTSELAQGAAGVAHLYRKLYQASHQVAYREGYSFWLGQTHSLLHKELATGFYRQREGDLLHGLAGVGLVLLSSLAEAELGWDALVL